MQRKLDWLSPISDPPDKNGIVYVNMKFDDGTLAYKGAKPADMVNHYADLLAISMSPELVEIELEDTGKKTQKGATKYKLVGYPGWSAPVAQGGKAQANASNGSRSTDRSIARAVALKAAVSRTVGIDVTYADILKDAEKFEEWLMRGEGQTDPIVPITEGPTDPIPASIPSSPVLSGEGQERDGGKSKGEPVSTGGSRRAGSPEDSPWAGMNVE